MIIAYSEEFFQKTTEIGEFISSSIRRIYSIGRRGQGGWGKLMREVRGVRLSREASAEPQSRKEPAVKYIDKQ
jgi:hypothetical protein